MSAIVHESMEGWNRPATAQRGRWSWFREKEEVVDQAQLTDLHPEDGCRGQRAHRGASTSFSTTRATATTTTTATGMLREVERKEHAGKIYSSKRRLVLVRLARPAALYVFHQAACSEFKDHAAESVICAEIFFIIERLMIVRCMTMLYNELIMSRMAPRE